MKFLKNIVGILSWNVSSGKHFNWKGFLTGKVSKGQGFLGEKAF